MTLSARIVDYMTPHPVTVPRGENVGRVREILLEQGFTVLPVVDDTAKLCGVVTPADLLHDDEDERLAERPVGEVMTASVVTASSTASVSDAAVSMASNRIHHVIVVDITARPVGVLSTLDIASAMVDADLAAKASALMSREVMTIDAGVTVGEALDLLEDSSVSAAVVLDGNDYVGLLTQLSLLTVESDDRVDEVMERNVVHCDADASVSTVALAFVENGVRRMLVVDSGGRVVGIVTPTDLVRYAAGLAEFDGPSERGEFAGLEDSDEFELVPFEAEEQDEDGEDGF